MKFVFNLCLSLVLKFLILAYRSVLSPLLGTRCRFLPTCSAYALDAITYYGPYKGTMLALKRISKCHPWGGHGFDPVEEKKP